MFSSTFTMKSSKQFQASTAGQYQQCRRTSVVSKYGQNTDTAFSSTMMLFNQVMEYILQPENLVYNQAQYTLDKEINLVPGHFYPVPIHVDTLRILFVCNAFNSMAQRLFLECTDLGHDVQVHVFETPEMLVEAVQDHQPEIIICPFLTSKVPEEIWRNPEVPCLIVHPGIEGDRGMSSIDWALKESSNVWGVTVLQAAEEMDAGDIWATHNFAVEYGNVHGRPNIYGRLCAPTKSSLYRGECIDAAVKGVKQALYMFQNDLKPRPLDYTDPRVKGTLRPKMKNADRRVDWGQNAEVVVAAIRSSDSQPGTLEEIDGVEYFMYGSHIERDICLNLQGTSPKQLLGKRDGAVLISCQQGAVWISHLKKKNTQAQKYFKLPATKVLPEEVVKRLPELPQPSLQLPFGKTPGTFQEIFYWVKNEVCYLWFNFYNGAMSTSQCRRLSAAWDHLENRSDIQTVVLMGGHDFFSNGVNLNTIEAAEDPAQESWLNINAIDDFVLRVLLSTKITVSAIQGNAGAGGAMMAIAADYVWTHGSVVLNPSYNAMHLYGSEYWTYSLPKRCGPKNARKLMKSTMPLSPSGAYQLGLVDEVLCINKGEFIQLVVEKCDKLMSDPAEVRRLLRKKGTQARSPTYREVLELLRMKELEHMKKCFVSEAYIAARKAFVYKARNLTCSIAAESEQLNRSSFITLQ
eukprot:TRINITY_DN2076_c0_g1_i1.p1 TRINITY_DN2076_c0_g1~~TRINITY_DN2076_c0_g1_i1.p1  ORF type:complete len:689 (-),score=67.38 TRINITY_DN2076_c0_g1_i1:1555-3621(-)